MSTREDHWTEDAERDGELGLKGIETGAALADDRCERRSSALSLAVIVSRPPPLEDLPTDYAKRFDNAADKIADDRSQ